MSAHRLPLAGLKVSVFTGLNAQSFISGWVRWDWIYEHLCGANNLVSRDYEMPFFIQGGLGPPEWKTAPPWKVQSTPKFTAAHQKCYMGHRVTCHFLAGSIRLWKFFTTLPEGTRLLDFWVHYPTLPYPKLKNHYPSGPDLLLLSWAQFTVV